MEAGTQQKGGSQGPDSDAEVETGDSQTKNVGEAADTPALEAPGTWHLKWMSPLQRRRPRHLPRQRDTRSYRTV